ncbi:hypothetical protein SDC9_79288 [bioreactor metagenome]|uniref:Gp5/Type VI secretion system Vgr protein OB-fold domain-containing protein n=1 Tax=bioreactor metagenome TaxID=1076179 RepID=A0A644Z1W7_9ZZZZ
MSLYDIIGEISEREAAKTETGDTRVYGVMIGIVAKNYDKDMPGRVCVTIPTRDQDANELQWARLSMPSSGTTWGHYFLPEVGDQVLLAFEGGNIEKPYIIGCVPKDSNKFLTKAVDQDNQYKRIVTKHGSSLSFEDSKEGDGAKDKITLQTALQGHTVLLDNENKVIRITDKDKANLIEMKTEDGAMTVKAASKLTIQVGDSIKIILNGSSGSIKVEAGSLSIETSNQLKAVTNGMLSLEGATVSAKASSVFKVDSSGMVTIAGTPIKIG